MDKSIEQQVNTIGRALYDDGTAMDIGYFGDDVPRLIKACKQRFPNKPYCAVKSWQWWDIEMNDDAKELYQREGKLPSLIKADCIIDDEYNRFPSAGWVRTSPLIELHDDCFFETANTVYILVGKGTRKTVSPKVIMSLF